MIRLILALFTLTTYAQLKDVDLQPLAFKNILKNGGFENGKALFSVTGSASLTTSTSNPAFGKVKGVVDFSASGEFMRTATTTLPEGLYGKNCYARFKYSGGGTADIYYRVTDGTNTLAGYTSTSTQFKITTAASTWTDSLDLTFPCPSSGGLRLELESAGNAAALSVDDIYIGENFKVGSVAQAEFYGGIYYANNTNCAWSTSSTSFTNYSADTDCSTATATGNASAPATKIPSALFGTIKPGSYLVTVTGTLRKGGTIDDGVALRLTDGTTNSSEVYSYHGSTTANFTVPFSISTVFTYTTPQSNLSFQVQGKSNSASNSAILLNDSANSSLQIQVYRFPLSSEVAVSANVPYQGGKATMTGATNCTWTSTSGSYASFANDADCNNFTFTGNLSACTNAKTPCVKVNSLEAGRYLVIANGQFSADPNTAGSFRIFDGTTGGGASVVANSPSTHSVSQSGASAVFEYNSKQTNIEFNVQAIRTFAGTNMIVQNNSTNLQFEMHVIPLSPSVAMPNLVGSVTSNTSGSERTERVTFGGATEGTNVCSSSPCTIYRGSGGVSSVTRTGTGAYEINFVAGTFSAIPTCNGNGSNLSTGFTTLEPVFSGSSATVFKFNARIFGTSNSADSYMNIQCQGPR